MNTKRPKGTNLKVVGMMVLYNGTMSPYVATYIFKWYQVPYVQLCYATCEYEVYITSSRGRNWDKSAATYVSPTVPIIFV